MVKSKGKKETPVKDPKIQTPTFKKKDKILKADKLKEAVVKTPPSVVKSTPKSEKRQKNTPATKQVS